MSEFSDFTKLVLDRMETNPDEFEPSNRWDTLVRALEARATGDMENRYAKTLWPLEPLELEAIMSKYRKLYLARIHKDMLRNIVSGADKERTQYQYDTYASTATGSVLTTSAMKQQTLGLLNQTFDKEYSNTMLGTAVADNSDATYGPISNSAPKVSKYVLNRAQVKMAQRLNMTPWEYANYAEAVAKRVNGGTE